MFEERKRIFQERLNFIHYFPIHLVIIHIRVQLFTVIARNFIHRYNSTNTTNFHIVFFRKRNKKKKRKKILQSPLRAIIQIRIHLHSTE